MGFSASDIQGFDEVVANLNLQIAKIKDKTMKGLIESAKLIRKDMDKTEPRIPIDTHNLEKSWVTAPYITTNDFGLTMGFGADYAAAVHEDLGANPQPGWRYGPGPGKKRWYDPRVGAGPKFFEYSVKRNSNQIMIICQRTAKIT